MNNNLPNSGKYIVIEGLEGAGKTTARDSAVQALQQAGIWNILFTREPGGTPLAENIRQLILQQTADEPLCDTSELLLFYAARAQLVETVIKPALANGVWVIGDRHDLSTQAYQGGGRGIDARRLQTLKKIATGDFAPHLTLYLDVEPQIGLQRIKTRGQLDRIEQETLDFFQRTRIRYQQLASKDPHIHTIDAMQSQQAVHAAIQQYLVQWIQAQTL